MSEHDPLAGKVVLVTGASSGIGRATCRELARQGADVILVARNMQGMRETASAMPEAHTLTLAADLRVTDTLPALVERGLEWRGRIDGLVHCAGIGGRARLRDTTTALMTEHMRVHCFAFVELMRCLARRKSKARPLEAVVVSSFASLGQDKYFTAYAASKAALEAAARTLAAELMPRNTRVNIIRPAFVDTPMVSDPADPLGDFRARLEESGVQPLGLIPPEQVARLAAYLLSPAASRITGAIFPINAGMCR